MHESRDSVDRTDPTGVAEIDAAIEAEWSTLAAPGAHFDGGTRVAIAARARAASGTAGDDHPDEVTCEAVDRVAHASPSITEAWVDDLEGRGLGRTAYVEVVGISGRLSAVDTFEQALGRPVRPLPRPTAGEPTGEVSAVARQRSGFVPVEGATGPPTALTAIPAEATAQEALSGALYLSYVQMADFAIVRGLARPQMELLAARVSYLNDCFF